VLHVRQVVKLRLVFLEYLYLYMCHLSYSSTNGYRIRQVVKLWVHSMENSASPNTTNGGNQNRRAIIIFNTPYCLYYINDNQ